MKQETKKQLRQLLYPLVLKHYKNIQASGLNRSEEWPGIMANGLLDQLEVLLEIKDVAPTLLKFMKSRIG